MIIIDFSQLLFAAVYNEMKLEKTKEPTEDGIRVIILNKIQYIRQKFLREYGKETVIAIDNGSWRKDVFEEYKYKRKKNREKDELDWKVINGYFNTIKSEIKENFSYKVIDISGAEGDDIIAVLSRYVKEPVVIVGQDKDYFQLHNKRDLVQYCPIKDVFLEFHAEDIPYNLFSHICRGDSSDGIPSIINQKNCFIKGIRQKPLKETYIKEAFNYTVKGMLEEFLGPENYKRFQENKVLIDFRCIPEDIKGSIISLYDNYEIKPNNAYKYLLEQNLMEKFYKEQNNF